jgi:hypothetical protein
MRKEILNPKAKWQKDDEIQIPGKPFWNRRFDLVIRHLATCFARS